MTRHGKSKASHVLAAMALLFAGADRAIGQEEPATTPSIVFVGTVDSPAAVNLPNVAASPNTSVVSVVSVLRKPDAIALVPGDKVTVLTEGTAPKKDEKATFFADGWIFGQSLGLRVHSWEPVSSAPAAVAAAGNPGAAAQIQALNDQDARALIANADIIVVGRIGKVLPLISLDSDQQIVSEHNPYWQQAIIEVSSSLKGAAGAGQVVVRFPASVDVMWAGFPKFKEGQEGTFLLQRDHLSPSTGLRLQDNSPAPSAYVAISAKHVLSGEQADRIKSLLAR
jgi:hypothetical protein